MRRLLAVLLILHGLAHAAPGMMATGPVWLVTALWLMATLCFVGSGLWLLGARIPYMPVDRMVFLGAVASTWLLSFYMFAWLIPGVLINLTFVALLLNSPWVVARSVETGVSWPRRVAAWAAMAFVVYTGAAIVAHPWFQRMGSTTADREASLFGDSLFTEGPYVTADNVITIRAPADSVWPWLAQLGQDRGGFYSYVWLENLFGAHIMNSDSIVPAWQQRAVGDFVRAVPPDYLGGTFGPNLGWKVQALDPGRAIVLENWGAFVVRPTDDHTSCLHIRQRFPRQATLTTTLLAPVGVLALQPAHYIMQRGMLRGIRDRAER
jgi:hypothetical protein